MSYQAVNKDVVGDHVKCLAKFKVEMMSKILPSFINQAVSQYKTIGHSLPLIKLCWLFLVTFLSFMSPERASVSTHIFSWEMK